MKKGLIILSALLSLAVLSCTKTPVPELSVSTNIISVGADGGTTIVTITTNQEWTATTDATWITLGAESGNQSVNIAIEVSAFTEAAARSASILVKAGSLQQTIAVVQSAPVAPGETETSTINVLALGGSAEVSVPSGYSFEVESSADWVTVEGDGSTMKITVAPNVDATENRTATVKALFGSDTLVETTINQSWRNVEPGELLIEEVYFTGSPIEGSTRPSEDQYIKLTNVSDHTIYADRVMFVTNYVVSTITSVGAYYEYPEWGNYLPVSDMFVIPGDGDDYPIEPGASIILAISAINYTEDNPNAIDLSKADFEFYGSDNEYFPDTDNPDVPNLLSWYKASFSYFYLHNRGYESYAIVTPPTTETAETIMENHHWTGTYYFHFKEYNFDYDLSEEDAWLIPGEWVLDAVNCSTEDSWYQNPWGDAFDAGWTHAGDYDGDQSRFGKSVRRKLVDGKLADTNNSTNDFEPNATPSLK